MDCPCGSGNSFCDCCASLIRGDRRAVTAEQLMRSRYSAFATGAIDHVLATMAPKLRRQQDEGALRTWAETSQWCGLEIITVEDGGEDDQQGSVEFMARYRNKDHDELHHERAVFRRHGGHWLYEDGQEISHKKPVLNPGRVGRNEPCPCGSGKKYKKCCGAT